MTWCWKTYSDSGDTAVESSFLDYDLDNSSVCTYLEPAPSSSPPSFYFSRPSSHRSPPSIDLEADDSNVDTRLQGNNPAATPYVIQPSKLVIQPNPPPLAAGHNYRPEVRAEELALVFSKLPPKYNTLGTSPPQVDGMLEDIQGELERLSAEAILERTRAGGQLAGTEMLGENSVTLVPLLVEPTRGANWTSQAVSAHPTDVNGHPCHGECGPHSCSKCHKSFCQESRLTRHERSHKKPHVCRVCGATRTWAHHLERHMATHGDLRLTCPIGDCPKMFKTTANMPRHLQNPQYHGLTKEQSRQVMAEYRRMLQFTT